MSRPSSLPSVIGGDEPIRQLMRQSKPDQPSAPVEPLADDGIHLHVMNHHEIGVSVDRYPTPTPQKDEGYGPPREEEIELERIPKRPDQPKNDEPPPYYEKPPPPFVEVFPAELEDEEEEEDDSDDPIDIGPLNPCCKCMVRFPSIAMFICMIPSIISIFVLVFPKFTFAIDLSYSQFVMDGDQDAVNANAWLAAKQKSVSNTHPEITYTTLADSMADYQSRIKFDKEWFEGINNNETWFSTAKRSLSSFSNNGDDEFEGGANTFHTLDAGVWKAGDRARSGESLTVVYYDSHGGNVLTDERIANIHLIEQSILKHSSYTKYCRTDGSANRCITPNSMLTFVYPSLSGDGQVVLFDGKGTFQQETTAVVQTLLTQKRSGFFSRTTSSSDPTSVTLVSTFEFGLPLDGATGRSTSSQKSEINSVIAELEHILADADGEYGFRVLRTGGDLFDREIMSVLMRDCILVAISMGIMFVYCSFYMNSIFLTTCGFIHMIMSFPPVLLIYNSIWGLSSFQMMNVVSLWLILGLGSDEMFVFRDTWSQYKYARYRYTDPPRLLRQLVWTWKRAFSSMTVTSLTTAAGFFATAISQLLPLRQFGVFLGLLVLVNFLAMLTWFPACITWHQKHRIVACDRAKEKLRRKLGLYVAADEDLDVQPKNKRAAAAAAASPGAGGAKHAVHEQKEGFPDLDNSSYEGSTDEGSNSKQSGTPIPGGAGAEGICSPTAENFQIQLQQSPDPVAAFVIPPPPFYNPNVHYQDSNQPGASPPPYSPRVLPYVLKSPQHHPNAYSTVAYSSPPPPLAVGSALDSPGMLGLPERSAARTPSSARRRAWAGEEGLSPPPLPPRKSMIVKNVLPPPPADPPGIPAPGGAPALVPAAAPVAGSLPCWTGPPGTFIRWYSEFVRKGRWIIILTFLAGAIYLGLQIPKLQPPSDLPQFLASDSNIEMLRRATKALQCDACIYGLPAASATFSSNVPTCQVSSCGTPGSGLNPGTIIVPPTGSNNPCAEITCQNGGSCSSGYCSCPSGYDGSRCENVNKCGGKSCGSHGYCEGATGLCRCYAQWSGSDCSISACASQTCFGHGTCNPSTGYCVCTSGWSGVSCDIPIISSSTGSGAPIAKSSTGSSKPPSSPSSTAAGGGGVPTPAKSSSSTGGAPTVASTGGATPAQSSTGARAYSSTGTIRSSTASAASVSSTGSEFVSSTGSSSTSSTGSSAASSTGGSAVTTDSSSTGSLPATKSSSSSTGGSAAAASTGGASATGSPAAKSSTGSTSTAKSSTGSTRVSSSTGSSKTQSSSTGTTGGAATAKSSSTGSSSQVVMSSSTGSTTVVPRSSSSSTGSSSPINGGGGSTGPKPISADLSLRIDIVYGVAGVDMSSKTTHGDQVTGEPIWDYSFDLSLPQAQLHVVQVCSELLNRTDVRPFPESKCMMLNFRNWMWSKGYKFPVPQNATGANIVDRLLTFLKASPTFNEDVGFVQWESDEYEIEYLEGNEYKRRETVWSANEMIKRMDAESTARAKNPFHTAAYTASSTWRVAYIRGSVLTYIDKDGGGYQLQPHYNEWNDWMNSVNERAPFSASGAFQTAETWSRMHVELAFIQGTIASIAVSVGIVAITLVVFTHSVHLLFFTILSVSIIVIALMAMLVLWDWPLGAMEAISVPLIIDLSTNYLLHLAHSYNLAGSADPSNPSHHAAVLRGPRTLDALLEVGPSVTSSAITILGSMSVLLFCRMHLFFEIGAIVSTTLGLGILMSMMFFTALTHTIGPEYEQGNILYWLLKANVWIWRVCFGILPEDPNEVKAKKEQSKANAKLKAKAKAKAKRKIKEERAARSAPVVPVDHSPLPVKPSSRFLSMQSQSQLVWLQSQHASVQAACDQAGVSMNAQEMFQLLQQCLSLEQQLVDCLQVQLDEMPRYSAGASVSDSLEIFRTLDDLRQQQSHTRSEATNTRRRIRQLFPGAEIEPMDHRHQQFVAVVRQPIPMHPQFVSVVRQPIPMQYHSQY